MSDRLLHWWDANSPRIDRLASKAGRLLAMFAVAYYGSHLAHAMPSWPESVAVGVITIAAFIGVGWLLEERT